METTKKKNGIVRVLLIAIGACLLYGISAGLRSDYGVLLGSVVSSSGVSYENVSFIVAVGQLVFGIAQPAFGVLALKKSNGMVLVLGAVLMILGLIGTAFSSAFALLLIAFGIVLPIGTGALSFGIIMSAATPKLGEKRAAVVSGFVSASSGIGSTVLSPAIQSLLANIGLAKTLFVLTIPIFLLIPISILLAHGSDTAAQEEIVEEEGEKQSFVAMVRAALHSRPYIAITIGFFTCGFHMSIIETHLYSQFLSSGIPDATAALAFSVYGIATIIGCILSGLVSVRVPQGRVLGVLYSSRCIIVLLWLLLPKTVVTAFCVSILLGLTGSSTVTPTSGLVTKLFGPAKMATLFGFTFFVHQIGAFFSAWLGGICVSATGGYGLIWCVGIVLSLIAGLSCFLGTREKTDAAASEA